MKANGSFNVAENRIKLKQLWNTARTELSRKYRAEVAGRLKNDPSIVFNQDVYADIQALIVGEKKSEVCVLGSGDNLAVFALNILGANVTSVDLSEELLKNARHIAEHYDLKIQFICADIYDLSAIPNAAYDLIYTSNGVLTWIDDLSRMFAEIRKKLRDNGSYILYDVHPFQRPWKDKPGVIEMEKPYNDIGPLQNPNNKEVKTFEWRVEDIVNALAGAGLHIRKMRERGSGPTKESGYFWGPEIKQELNDWRINPLAGLPAWIEIIAEKHA